MSDVPDEASRLQVCRDRWSLHLHGALSGGARSSVFAAVDQAGAELVVKLSATVEEAATEAAALGAWSDTGAAATLLDVDTQVGALLLQRLRPGTPLPRGSADLREVAAILDALHTAPPIARPFPTLAGTSDAHAREALADLAHERRAREEPHRAVVAERSIPGAAHLLEGLCATAATTVLLHGDFLPKNLLADGGSFRAIDPIPHHGDPCADIGAFASDQESDAIHDTAAEMAERLTLAPDRAIAWSTVWTVMVATQAWRPDQVELDRFVGSTKFQGILDAGF